ncbi:uncharacterized protein LOC144565786 [Carex rostrata]
MDPFRSLVKYSLRVLMLGFFLSSLTWVPQVYHFFIIFFSVSLPKIISMAVAPKSLFIVSNLIVIFLFGESKLGKCTKNDEYDCMIGNEKVEYFEVERKMLSYEISKETDHVEIIQENKEVEVVEVVEERDIVDIVDKKEIIMIQEDGEEGERECEEMEMREDEEEMEREEEEMEEWPAEEFNKRVEDFIAKFNMQIRLEARMAISCY